MVKTLLAAVTLGAILGIVSFNRQQDHRGLSFEARRGNDETFRLVALERSSLN